MKEPEYDMTIMVTGRAQRSEGGKEAFQIQIAVDGQQKSTNFNYAKLFDYHFHYCHAGDNHNNLHHAFPNIEGTWVTEQWPI